MLNKKEKDMLFTTHVQASTSSGSIFVTVRVRAAVASRLLRV